jgi:hypothetical protein
MHIERERPLGDIGKDGGKTLKLVTDFRLLRWFPVKVALVALLCVKRAVLPTFLRYMLPPSSGSKFAL